MQCQRLQVIGCATTNLPTSTRLPSCQMAYIYRNYTAMRTHVQWSVHLSALLIT